jgi:flagellar biosynthesis GTPase FlhF
MSGNFVNQFEIDQNILLQRIDNAIDSILDVNCTTTVVPGPRELTEKEKLEAESPKEHIESIESLMQKVSDSLYERVKQKEAEKTRKLNQEKFEADLEEIRLQGEAAIAKAEEERIQNLIQEAVAAELERHRLLPSILPGRSSRSEETFATLPRNTISRDVLREYNLTYHEHVYLPHGAHCLYM